MTDSDKNTTPNNTEKCQHPKDPLHGVTLKSIVIELEENYGWQGLAERIPVNCFKSNPSLKSSLTFLRKTPWAREKVEQLYIQSKQNWGKYKKN
ncbi:VF530 family DNA-binding protein [Thiomicrorhabdus sp. Kp2]|uniref:VF530 family protein n=1 Tax=Thiomicrorhabdus sp. Kp2 TaxID=1123518 RepID=UPI000427E0F8|nr:VF530 family protein [Thiomicrorhabdus sp. Kp2]